MPLAFAYLFRGISTRSTCRLSGTMQTGVLAALLAGAAAAGWRRTSASCVCGRHTLFTSVGNLAVRRTLRSVVVPAASSFHPPAGLCLWMSVSTFNHVGYHGLSVGSLSGTWTLPETRHSKKQNVVCASPCMTSKQLILRPRVIWLQVSSPSLQTTPPLHTPSLNLSLLTHPSPPHRPVVPSRPQ